MEKKEIAEKVRELIAEEFELDIEKIMPEVQLKDGLGLDSLDFVDVVVLVQENFGIKLKGQDFAGIVTFSDFCGLLDKRING